MRVRTLVETEGPNGLRPAGEEIIHPDAWRLCEMGIAEPVDGQAKEKMEEIAAQKAKRAEVVAARRARMAAVTAPEVVAPVTEDDDTELEEPADASGEAPASSED